MDYTYLWNLYHASYSSAIGRNGDSFEESCGELTRFEDRLNHLATLLQCDSDAIRRLSGTRSFSTMEYLRAKEDFLPKPYSMQDGSGEYFSSLYVDSSLDLQNRSSRIRLLNDVTGGVGRGPPGADRASKERISNVTNVNTTALFMIVYPPA